MSTIIISCLLTAMTIILGYIAFKITDFKKFVKKFVKKPKNKPDEKYSAKKFNFIQERQFFRKYANVKNSEFRTVTVSRAVLQALGVISHFQKLEIQKLVEKDSSENERIAANNLTVNTTAETECDYGDIVERSLFDTEEEYEEYLTEALGVDLKKICKCPGGEGYCDWTPDMFRQFIVNLNVWDLISIQIFQSDQENNSTLISTSTISDIVIAPLSNHAVVIMSDQDTLNALPEGTIVKIVFKWRTRDRLGNIVEHCITLVNIIKPRNPDELVEEETTETF